MTIEFADPNGSQTPLHLLSQDARPDWGDVLSPDNLDWLDRLDFTGALGQAALVPDEDGAIAVAGYGTPESRSRGRFHLGIAAAKLPSGAYRLVTELPEQERAEQILGWLLTGYRFDRYKTSKGSIARLVAPEGPMAERLLEIARGEALVRDLINIPANDMGPEELEEAATDLAKAFGGSISVISGEELKSGFPLIHTVGRAAARTPRLIDMRWGQTGPTVTLVGKGVCFDTGGLNLKPGGSMALMKKDMGGAANVLGLAQIIMALGLELRLRVLIPAVENSVSADAFRPGDILRSRKGLTVEINNTDAEGRLVLADALALAAEEAPDLLVSMATLTGAARVAVGPDIAPYFTDDDRLSANLDLAGRQVADPVWRLPFHAPYERMIEPGIADLDNAPKGGMAGSITAALFLRRFAEGAPRYVHFDVYGWQPTAQPARPAGGVGQGIRAILETLSKEFSGA